ncbi:MAG TPA: SAM-dependent methyltransferase [Polyangia bacterium]|nr:SAM-dependent methyltransferase [Polyangia bacterium]
MRRALLLAVLPSLISCATQHSTGASANAITIDHYRAIVAAADRLDADRALDAGRKPAELLAFLRVAPGMRVAELGAGRGYTTELLARAVAPNGVVYAQNPPALARLFGADPLAERLARPVNAKVVRSDREFDDPLPPEARDLDLVLINAFYHDAVWMKSDRDRMNRAVFAALKPGGRYVVSDSSARPGSGVADAQTLHRIDEQVVREEVARAGFKLEAESDLLRNPADTRDWSASPRAAGERRGTSDRFTLAFVKPAS